VLAELAAAHGVATAYEDWQGRLTPVAPEVVAAVLDVLGVDPTGAAAPEPRPPATVVVREGATRATAHRAVLLEDGTERPIHGRIPADVPTGYHQLVDATRGAVATPLVVTPARLPDPPRAWGWLLQLYALRSAGSWGGMGDLRDLADAASRAGADGAGFVLLNPLHAVAPGFPVPASPYSPSSRRYVNPLYLRVEDTAAYRAADPATRAAVDARRPPRPTGGPTDGLIDYDAVWRAKQAALELLAPPPGPPAGPARDFATYNALAERHGRDWRTWPEPLRRPDSPAVAQAATELAERVAFHAWLQEQCDDQLDAARRASAGMSVGIVHDLAVGVDPGGADGWLLRDVLADGVRIGAPPDAFNQLGQDWGLAAWRPDRLAATGYAPYRDLLRAVLRHAGGLRVDHVAGLWRLWWVPPGASADQGTYVRYDPEAMVGILALEAQRAGAVVIGEDLGTVLPEVTDGLAERNMLGCSVLWFTRDWDTGEFKPPADWPVNSLASISTHDLPTAAGFLTGDHVRVRAEAGVLARPEGVERAAAARDKGELLGMLRAEGLIEPAECVEPDDDTIIAAMHELLARTPCRLVAISPYDVLGDVRQPNLPGTVDEYPNWRLPLPVTLDQLFADPRVRRAVAVFKTQRRA
jgi:4-alpha-glucanotransferase